MAQIMTPRPYQTRAIAAARQCFAQGAKAPVIVSPTGSGKTYMMALIAQSHLAGVTGDLGRPDVDREFSLEGDPITVKDRDERNRNRLCRSCKAPLGDLVTCPECGFETPLPVYANLPAVDFDAAKAAALKLTGASKMVRALAGMMIGCRTHRSFRRSRPVRSALDNYP